MKLVIQPCPRLHVSCQKEQVTALGSESNIAKVEICIFQPPWARMKQTKGMAAIGRLGMKFEGRISRGLAGVGGKEGDIAQMAGPKTLAVPPTRTCHTCKITGKSPVLAVVTRAMVFSGTIGSRTPDDDLTRRMLQTIVAVEHHNLLLMWSLMAPTAAELNTMPATRINLDDSRPITLPPADGTQ